MDCHNTTGTTLNDSSATANNGTLTGPTWTPRAADASGSFMPALFVGAAYAPASNGAIGGAMSYTSSSSGYAIVPYNSGINCGNNITISAWFATGSTARQTIFSHSSDTTAGCVELEVNGIGSRSIGIIIPGVFVAYTAAGAYPSAVVTHVAYTRNGSGLNHKIYINGVEQTLTTNATNSFLTTTKPSVIGSRNGSTQTWYGNIDELMIFNKALGLTDVKRLMMGLHPLAN